MYNLKNEHGGIKLITLISIILVAIIILFGFVFYKNNSKKNQSSFDANNQATMQNNDKVEKQEELIKETSYIEIQQVAELVELPTVKITDKEAIEKLRSEINNSSEVTQEGVGVNECPIVTFYHKDGTQTEISGITTNKNNFMYWYHKDTTDILYLAETSIDVSAYIDELYKKYSSKDITD